MKQTQERWASWGMGWLESVERRAEREAARPALHEKQSRFNTSLKARHFGGHVRPKLRHVR